MAVPHCRNCRLTLRAVGALGAVAITAGLSSPAWSCGSGDGEIARVTRVIDALTVQTESLRELRLAGLAPPFASTEANPEDFVEVNTALEQLARGQQIRVRLASRQPTDRYGRLYGYVTLAASDQSLQEMIVLKGLARVDPAAIDDVPCRERLLALEKTARKAREGLWVSPGAIKDAADAAELKAIRGHFVIAEGSVQSVRQAGATIFINFGRHYRRNLALTMPRRLESRFQTAGLAAKSLENRRIRVRGYVEYRSGGPRIALTEPHQIELLADDSGTTN